MSAMNAESVSDDELLKNLHAQYEQALSRNKDARSRLTQIQDTWTGSRGHPTAIVTSRIPAISDTRQRNLESHLENLRLRKQQKNLQTLSRCALEAEQIASEDHIFEAFEPASQAPPGPATSNQQTTVAQIQRHLNALDDGANIMTTNLEVALVKARQQLKSEQNMLEQDRKHAEGGQNGTDDLQNLSAKLQAMEATRNQLQNWIEEGLVRCEKPIAQLPGEDLPSLETADLQSSGQESNALIDSEYEQYLEARAQLVHVSGALRAPLPDLVIQPQAAPTPKSQPEAAVITEDPKHKISLQRAPHLRHKSRISIHKMAEQSGSRTFPQIESTDLPEYQHEKLLSRYAAYLDAQNTAQDARMLQSLSLLSHESHLLPSYPLSSVESPSALHSHALSQQQTEIDRLLYAWGFASQTADGVLTENVLANIEEARSALKRATQRVDEIHLVESMRVKVATGKR